MHKFITILFFALFAALSLPAQSAQPSPPPAAVQSAEPSSDQLKSIVNVMRSQRDANAQAAQDAQAQLALLSAEVEALKKQLAEAQAKLAAATKPKDAEKTAATESPSQPEKKS